jgi:hypothetical protein
MPDAYIACDGHMRPATEKYCMICREKERIARDETKKMPKM